MSQGSPIREDGDVKTTESTHCSQCHGINGHHTMGCPALSSENAGKNCPECRGFDGHHNFECSLAPQETEAQGGVVTEEDKLTSSEERRVITALRIGGEFDEQKLPPTDDDIASNNLLWLVAKLCHEVNRVYCQSIGDHSQVEWEHAPDWQRESSFNGVTMHFDNPSATAEDSHKSWCDEKIVEGWKYGPVKDVDRKEHPCLVPYNQLHVTQRYKDALFTTICKTVFGAGL